MAASGSEVQNAGTLVAQQRDETILGRGGAPLGRLERARSPEYDLAHQTEELTWDAKHSRVMIELNATGF